MKDQERLVEDEEGNKFWWQMCEKEDCTNQVCLWASKEFCYPHSKWYRPVTAKINRVISYFT